MSDGRSHGDAKLTIGRWSATYLVSRNCPSQQNLQQQFDDLVQSCLAAECALSLDQFLDAADTTVWRIRKLSMNMSVGSGSADSDDLARQWGGHLAAEVRSVIDQGEQSDSVLRFPNKAAFLAQFIFDLASGCAWGKWYYREFRDLRVLSLSQAICTAVLSGEVSAADVTMQLLATGRLEAVLGSLSDGGARTIYESCFEKPSGNSRAEDLDEWTGTILELWNEAPLRAASQDENRFRDALRLLVRTISRFPDARGDASLKAAIDGVLDLRHLFLALHDASATDSVISGLAKGDLRSAVDAATSAGVSGASAAMCFFAERMHGDTAWAAQAISVVLGSSFKEKFLTLKTVSEGESLLSSVGGIFLLGPSFEVLRLGDLAAAAAESSDSRETTAATLCHLAALKCLGRTRAVEASDDPALRLFSGLTRLSFRAALEGIDLSQLNLAGAKRLFLEALLDRGTGSEPCLYAALVASKRERDTLVLCDLARDEWLDAIPIPDGSVELAAVVRAAFEKLFSLLRPLEPRRKVFFGESLAAVVDPATFDNAHLRSEILSRTDEPTLEQLAGQLGLSREQVVMHSSSAERHFSYFALTEVWPDFELVPALDSTFSLVARAALKHFARRLFGFAASSPDYVYTNFLLGVSRVKWTRERLEVRLPSSPLFMVLRMAGFHEQKYTPGWLRGSEVCLVPPQE